MKWVMLPPVDNTVNNGFVIGGFKMLNKGQGNVSIVLWFKKEFGETSQIIKITSDVRDCYVKTIRGTNLL